MERQCVCGGGGVWVWVCVSVCEVAVPTHAAVFPEPVLALISKSFPSRASGMAFSCEDTGHTRSKKAETQRAAHLNWRRLRPAKLRHRLCEGDAIWLTSTVREWPTFRSRSSSPRSWN